LKVDSQQKCDFVWFFLFFPCFVFGFEVLLLFWAPKKVPNSRKTLRIIET